LLTRSCMSHLSLREIQDEQKLSLSPDLNLSHKR